MNELNIQNYKCLSNVTKLIAVSPSQFEGSTVEFKCKSKSEEMLAFNDSSLMVYITTFPS